MVAPNGFIKTVKFYFNYSVPEFMMTNLHVLNLMSIWFSLGNRDRSSYGLDKFIVIQLVAYSHHCKVTDLKDFSAAYLLT